MVYFSELSNMQEIIALLRIFKIVRNYKYLQNKVFLYQGESYI